MQLAEAIARLYQLRVDTTTKDGDGSPHEKPHKPLLLLAALDLIDEGLASPERIPWCQELRDRFSAGFELVRKLNDRNNPDLPFRYLAGDEIWLALEADGKTPIRRDILVSDIGQVFARFTIGFELLAALPECRQQMREAIVARYFPWAADTLLDGTPQAKEDELQAAVAEDAADYGRSPAFRRNILKIYDHQCAACGLRIRLPAGANVSFIDAAHLLPWDRFHNDHPTNGLALCKNHHWAMDRQIIAPAPDHRWIISKVIDPRRSNGEKELSELSGKSLLLPKDPAFYPNAEGLEWRVRSLVAV